MIKHDSQMRLAARSIVVLVAAVLLSGCAWPSERAGYRIAIDAVKASPELPKSAVLPPMSKCQVNIGKSAGSVIVPYEFTDASGARQTASYTVWLKRIARTWVLDRCFPTPTYPATDAQAAAK